MELKILKEKEEQTATRSDAKIPTITCKKTKVSLSEPLVG